MPPRPGLVRVLQSQIAMTPRGSYRTALERHLRETRDHARRIETRLGELGRGGNPLQAGIGVAETVIAQGLAIAKTPFDLLRGSGGEEKVLKNAKDAAATEALEIATYTAIERLARDVGDEETARLAASIRADEERMLARVLAGDPEAHRRRRRLGRARRGLLRREEDRRGGRDARSRAQDRHEGEAHRAPGPGRRTGRGNRARRRRPRAGPPDRALRRADRRRDRRQAPRAQRRSSSPR